MKNLREPWGKVSCPVLVATGFRSQWMSQYFGCSAAGITNAISDSPHYNPAKKENNIDASIEVCRHALDKAYRTRVKIKLNALKAKGYGDPIFVAPCKPTSQNALAITAARFLGKKLKIEVDNQIQEKPCPSRRDTDRRAKFFQRPEFTGEVEKGRLYILIDDMITTGATLAELRSHIVCNGGHVAFACSLASCDGMDTQLHLSSNKLTKVEKMFKSIGDTVQKIIQNDVGLTPSTLTELEAEFFSSGKGEFAIRQHILSANLT